MNNMQQVYHNENELLALLRLQCLPKIGDITAKKLISHCGSAAEIFTQKKSKLQLIEGIGQYTVKELHHSAYANAAEKELQFIYENQIHALAYTDAQYPNKLKHCIDAPILLFSRGNFNWSNKHIISVVGTRNMTSYGQAFCEKFKADLAPLRPVIVSGFAYGVDICAQRAAINNRLPTIGCLAHGLNQIYPKGHQKYVSQVEDNGAFFTEFHSTSKPDRENFLKRNRIIAGMSEATIVIESAEKGGSLVTADIAHSYDRDVFALPGRASDTYSTGCNNLIKQQKAHLLTSAADLVYMLNWEIEEKKTQAVQKQLFVELTEIEKTIYQHLQKEGKQLLDTIAITCSIPVFKVSSTLITMEMKGVVRPLPGKLFEAI